MDMLLKSGAENCVVECGGVTGRTRLFVVSEHGAVDEAVVDAIVSAGRDAGARVETVWGERIPKEAASSVPTEVLAAYREADVIVSHYPSLKREVLFDFFGSENRVRVPNRARSTRLLCSEWARFPYAVQRTVAERMDELMKPGLRWQITSPGGTDLTGTFAVGAGEVGAAFFVDHGEGRARRNFPGGVHSPRNCINVNGVMVVEYMDGVVQTAEDEPLRLEVKDGRVVGVSGGDPAGKARASIEASDGCIDSWHAGVNPRTEVPVNRNENANEWFNFSHCSPAVMHFHLGRTHATTNLAFFDQTLVVDDVKLYEDGDLVVYNDNAIGTAIKRANLGSEMLRKKDFLRW